MQVIIDFYSEDTTNPMRFVDKTAVTVLGAFLMDPGGGAAHPNGAHDPLGWAAIYARNTQVRSMKTPSPHARACRDSHTETCVTVRARPAIVGGHMGILGRSVRSNQRRFNGPRCTSTARDGSFLTPFTQDLVLLWFSEKTYCHWMFGEATCAVSGVLSVAGWFVSRTQLKCSQCTLQAQ